MEWRVLETGPTENILGFGLSKACIEIQVEFRVVTAWSAQEAEGSMPALRRTPNPLSTPLVLLKRPAPSTLRDTVSRLNPQHHSTRMLPRMQFAWYNAWTLILTHSFSYTCTLCSILRTSLWSYADCFKSQRIQKGPPKPSFFSLICKVCAECNVT